MRSARIQQAGLEHDLVIEERRDPEPTDNQVVIEVEACGVCHRDLIDRAGRFPFMVTPITPGHEAVGRVIARGGDVTEWQVGDRVASMHRDFCGECGPCKQGEISLCQSAASVLGLIIDGGYSQRLLAPEHCFYRMPDSLDAAQAAVLHCTFGTAFRGLSHFGQLGAGQHALITGANGGVGSAAVQIARRLGADVTAVVRDVSHRGFLEELGATRVLVDDGGGFHKRLDGEQADVVLDCVGQATFNASLRSARVGGRVVVVGNVMADKAQLNLGYLITRGIQLIGSSGATRANMVGLLALHEAAPFSIPIDRSLPLDEADAAQRAVAAGGLRGRIVLRP